MRLCATCDITWKGSEMPEIPQFSHSLRMAIEAVGVSRAAERSGVSLSKMKVFLAGKGALTTDDVDALQGPLQIELDWWIGDD